jgi:hypothetical protein
MHSPIAAAASLFSSFDEAMVNQLFGGAAVGAQLAPPLVEV